MVTLVLDFKLQKHISFAHKQINLLVISIINKIPYNQGHEVVKSGSIYHLLQVKQNWDSIPFL
jgi:hypothetical protein